MLLRDDYFLTQQGGGPEGDRIAGAMKGAHVAIGGRFTGYAGSSIGAINSACGAFHIPDSTVKELYSIYLQKNRFLDPSLSAFAKLSLLDWRRIEELCNKTFGKNARIGDAVSDLIICATSLDTKSPFYFSKRSTPKCYLREVLRVACAIHPRITGAYPVPSLGTELNPDIRRFVDGGWTDNTCDAVFDDRGARIAIRLKHEESERVRSVLNGGGIFDEDIATFKCSLYASSQPKTKRIGGVDIILKRGAGWDFSKTEQQIHDSYQYGFETAIEAIQKRKGVQDV
jgi:predicted acylesterase/phospholipase RssA